MQSILVYKIPKQDRFTLEMPKGARIIHTATTVRYERRSTMDQHGKIIMNMIVDAVLWAQADTSKENEERLFVVLGDGDDVPEDIDNPPLKHVGTFLIQPSRGNTHAFHVYEETLGD